MNPPLPPIPAPTPPRRDFGHSAFGDHRRDDEGSIYHVGEPEQEVQDPEVNHDPVPRRLPRESRVFHPWNARFPERPKAQFGGGVAQQQSRGDGDREGYRAQDLPTASPAAGTQASIEKGDEHAGEDDRQPVPD